ncbi:hypothetical protein BH09BAC1_BH09BAC1_08590 [soil metagenome]
MSLKNELHQHCLYLAQEQVDNLNAIQAELKEALGSESKSTAGDKHETGRAMIQLEQERAGHQLRQAEELLLALQSINVLLPPADSVQLGSLASTTKGSFYISVGLGKVLLEEVQYFVVSPTAPVAAALIGKRVGEKAVFNGQEVVVLGIE